MREGATVSLAELAEVNPKTDLRNLHEQSPVSFIPMSDVTESGQWPNRQERILEDVRVGYTPFADDDVLFAKITPCMENGKGMHAVGLKNGVGFGSTEFHVLRKRGNNSARFLFHCLQSKKVRQRAIAFMGGSAGQQRVQAEFFDHFRVTAFKPDEQSRIAAVLDTVDEMIEKTEAVIAKLRQVRTGLLHDLLACGLDENGQLRDPVAHPEQFQDTPLGLIPKAWKIASLVSQISFPEGQVDPSIDPYCSWTLIAPDHVESGTGTLLARVTALQQGAISGKYMCEPDDVIYSKIRPYLRKAVLATERGLCSADMYPLRPNEGIDSRFLLAVVLSEAFTRFASAVSMRSGFPKINRDEMAGFATGWPDSGEQNRIADMLAAADAETSECAKELAKLQQLKSGLMDDLLTGRVRVPEGVCCGG